MSILEMLCQQSNARCERIMPPVTPVGEFLRVRLRRIVYTQSGTPRSETSPPMRWKFLIGAVVSVLMALTFACVSVYYLFYFHSPWKISLRLIGPLAATALWTVVAYRSVLKFRGLKPR
jgi:hypothetical protein